jgi:hypothetical protein
MWAIARRSAHRLRARARRATARFSQARASVMGVVARALLAVSIALPAMAIAHDAGGQCGAKRSVCKSCLYDRVMPAIARAHVRRHTTMT